MLFKEMGIYSKKNLWNVRVVLGGKSTEGHELYSRERTEIIEYVAQRCTYIMIRTGTIMLENVFSESWLSMMDTMIIY